MDTRLCLREEQTHRLKCRRQTGAQLRRARRRGRGGHGDGGWVCTKHEGWRLQAAPSALVSCPQQPLNVSVFPGEKNHSPTSWSSSKATVRCSSRAQTSGVLPRNTGQCGLPLVGSGTRLSGPPSPALWTLTGPGHGRETAVLLLSPREVRLQLLGIGDREGGARDEGSKHSRRESRGN